MAGVVEIRGVKLGEGIPKICVPLIATGMEDIAGACEGILGVCFDLVEWRADHFEGIFDRESVKAALGIIREKLGNRPLLFTFRTAEEGGEKSISATEYAGLLKFVCSLGLVDLVDVEIFRGDNLVSDIISFAHSQNVRVIASNHDFQKTPAKEDIIERLKKMQDMDADITKIAVMPQNRGDVLTLLSATEEMKRLYADRPLVTMSMAGDGLISRLAGEVFGSDMTFGIGDKASAPGQIETDKLKTVLDIIHLGMKGV